MTVSIEAGVFKKEINLLSGSLFEVPNNINNVSVLCPSAWDSEQCVVFAGGKSSAEFEIDFKGKAPFQFKTYQELQELNDGRVTIERFIDNGSENFILVMSEAGRVSFKEKVSIILDVEQSVEVGNNIKIENNGVTSELVKFRTRWNRF